MSPQKNIFFRKRSEHKKENVATKIYIFRKNRQTNFKKSKRKQRGTKKIKTIFFYFFQNQDINNIITILAHT